MNEWMNEWMNKWMNEWMNGKEWNGMEWNGMEWNELEGNGMEWMEGHRVAWHGPNGKMDGWMDERMKRHDMNSNERNCNEWTNAWRKQTNERTNEQVNECMNELMNEWMIEWNNESMYKWMNERVSENWFNARMKSRAHFCRPHLPKVIRTWQFINMIKWKQSFYYSLVHIFADPIFQKCSGTPAYFFSKWESSSRYSLARFLSTTFPHWGAKPRKQRPSCGNTAHSRVFEAWTHTFPHLLHFPTTWYWCCCHHDVVAMVMPLPWWCVCHDGEEADHDNRP